jgi:hypothetical protein
MAVKFSELLEGSTLSESARVAIQEAWESHLAEAREEVTAELREEFAQRYDHDKGMIVEAVDSFITTRIKAEIAELAEDKKSLAEQKVRYHRAVREHTKVLDRFVTEMVAKEVKELHADRSRVSEHVSKLDNFVAQQLAEELKEFHEDKKALVEQKVKMTRDSKRQLAESKREFIRKAANTIEKSVNRVISEEVKQFRTDITSARENDFGRRIFEAFASEYNTSYLNEAKETKKIQKALANTTRQLAEAKTEIARKQDAMKLAESKLSVAQDRFSRKEKLDELTRALGREKKEMMLDLLESVKTERLTEAFNKYLPSVLDGAPLTVRKTLRESVVKEHTGNRLAPAKTAEAEDDDADVVNIDVIRKLAGLSSRS